MSEEKTPLRKTVSTSSSVTSDSDGMSPITQKKPDKSAFFNELDWQSEGGNMPPANGSVAKQPEAEVFQPIVTPTTEIPAAVPGQGIPSLIDIGTPSPVTKQPPTEPFADFHQNTNISAPSNQGDLVDPFASLATSRSEPSPPGSTNNILLNFGEEEEEHSSTVFQIGPDLINSTANAGISNRNESPDVLPNNAHSSQKQKSLDNLSNDDFFGELNSAFAPSSTNQNMSSGHQLKQPTDPFMRNHHEVPKKSSSESNLLEINDMFGGHQDTLIPEPQPLHHSASSGSVADSGRTQTYDPFGDLGSFGATPSSSTTFSGTRQQPVAPGAKSSSARNSPTFNKQPQQQQQQRQQQQQQSRQSAPNYNVFVPGNTESVFGKSQVSGGGGGGWGKCMRYSASIKENESSFCRVLF